MADGSKEFTLHSVFGFRMPTSLFKYFPFALIPSLQDKPAQGQPQQQQNRRSQQRQQPGGLWLHTVFIHGVNQVTTIDNPLIAQ
ncbi:hypothetical protein D3C77_716070 [compost metagenome]